MRTIRHSYLLSLEEASEVRLGLHMRIQHLRRTIQRLEATAPGSADLDNAQVFLVVAERVLERMQRVGR